MPSQSDADRGAIEAFFALAGGNVARSRPMAVKSRIVIDVTAAPSRA